MTAGLSDRASEDEWDAEDIKGIRPIPPGAVPKVNPDYVPEVVPQKVVPQEVIQELSRPIVPILPKPLEMVSITLHDYYQLVMYGELVMFSDDSLIMNNGPIKKLLIKDYPILIDRINGVRNNILSS